MVDGKERFKGKYVYLNRFARMAELVDALVSGTSVRKDVQVRVLFRVQKASIYRGFCRF